MQLVKLLLRPGIEHDHAWLFCHRDELIFGQPSLFPMLGRLTGELEKAFRIDQRRAIWFDH